MGNKQITLPNHDTQEYGYRLAYRIACEKLAEITDIEHQCRKTDAQYLPSQNAVAIDYLNQPYLVSLNNGEVSLVNGADAVPMRDKILILHYFIQAKGTPLSGKLITYQELIEGINYFPVFAKRAINPLVKFFGNEPDRLPDVASHLDGHKADYGDAAVTINAFRRTPVTLVLWKGDEEFAPEGSIMFDSTISDYLTNDDIHQLCEIITWKLVKLLKAGGDSPDKS